MIKQLWIILYIPVSEHSHLLRNSLLQIHFIRFLIFILLVHVFNHMLQNKKIGPLTCDAP